jgi:hypothetical protein
MILQQLAIAGIHTNANPLGIEVQFFSFPIPITARMALRFFD